MSITIKTLEEMDSYNNEGHFNFVGKSLGVTSFGLNVLKHDEAWDGYPEHDHTTDFPDNQEEVYIILKGTGVMKADGKTYDLEPGQYIHVPPHVKRKIIPGDSGMTIISLGGIPGKPYGSSI